MKIRILALSIIATMTACIGDEGSLPNYYTEATTDSQITADNAEEVVDAVVDGEKISSSFSSFGTSSHKALHKGVMTARSFHDDDDDSSAFQSGTTEGTCGGSMTVDLSSTTNASITYDNYCISSGEGSEVTTNGSIKVSGSADQTTGAITSNYTMDLQVIAGDNVSKAAGTMKMSIDEEFNTTIVMNFTSSAGASGDAIKLDNYTIVTKGFSMATMSGDMCSTEIDGCVSVSTPTEFESTLGGDYSAGVLQIDAGSTVVKVTVNDSGQCDLSLDGETIDTQDCTDYL